MKLARVIDMRSRETVERLEPAPKTPPQGMAWSQNPKYRLIDLLREPVDEPLEFSVDDAPPLPALAHLPTSGL